MDERATSRFAAGDHVRVWRRLGPAGYYHHGIYVNDGRVVQFGGGIAAKPHATVGAVTLSRFQKGGTAKRVPRGGPAWWGAPRFEALPKGVTVSRAERLVEAHPEGLYDLFGYNCEHAANFCSTNSYESYQVRGYFAVRSVVGIPVALSAAARNRRAKWGQASTLALAASLLSGLVPHALSQLLGERFMREAGRPLLRWERDQGR